MTEGTASRATRSWLDTYDEAIAKRFLAANEGMTGLPAFLGIRLVAFSPGRLRAEMEVKPELLTPFGNMHGGVLSAVCDHVLGCVCYPHMARGQWAATTEFKINLLAPVSRGVVATEAEIVSMTRSTAVVRITIRNEGRAVCLAQGTVLIRDPKP
ncbi:MAG: PaaI family thioesterase [Myxococcota bacterium]